MANAISSTWSFESLSRKCRHISYYALKHLWSCYVANPNNAHMFLLSKPSPFFPTKMLHQLWSPKIGPSWGDLTWSSSLPYLLGIWKTLLIKVYHQISQFLYRCFYLFPFKGTQKNKANIHTGLDASLPSFPQRVSHHQSPFNVGEPRCRPIKACGYHLRENKRANVVHRWECLMLLFKGRFWFGEKLHEGSRARTLWKIICMFEGTLGFTKIRHL